MYSSLWSPSSLSLIGLKAPLRSSLLKRRYIISRFQNEWMNKRRCPLFYSLFCGISYFTFSKNKCSSGCIKSEMCILMCEILFHDSNIRAIGHLHNYNYYTCTHLGPIDLLWIILHLHNYLLATLFTLMLLSLLITHPLHWISLQSMTLLPPLYWSQGCRFMLLPSESAV